MYVYFIAMQVVLYISYMQLLEWHYNYCIINIYTVQHSQMVHVHTQNMTHSHCVSQYMLS